MKNLDLIFAIVLSFLLLILGAPWWTLALVAAGFGWLSTRGLRATAMLSLLSAGAWVGLALIQDARAEFRMSSRLAGLFELPSASLIYVIIFVMAGVVVVTAASLGWSARRSLE